MSLAFNGRSVLEHFECVNAIEIHNGIMFDFSPGLPHMYNYHKVITNLKTTKPQLGKQVSRQFCPQTKTNTLGQSYTVDTL